MLSLSSVGILNREERRAALKCKGEDLSESNKLTLDAIGVFNPIHMADCIRCRPHVFSIQHHEGTLKRGTAVFIMITCLLSRWDLSSCKLFRHYLQFQHERTAKQLGCFQAVHFMAFSPLIGEVFNQSINQSSIAPITSAKPGSQAVH